MRKRLLGLFAVLIVSTACLAQTYEGMCDSLNDASLPLVNLTVDIDKVSKAEYTSAELDIADPLRRTDSNVASHFRCKVKYRGSSAMAYHKLSFAVKLVDDNDAALDAPVLGIRKSDNWILNAMAIDRIRMRDRVLFDVWNDMSAVPYETDFSQRNGTKGHFVELFINGNYHGLYCLTDKINRKLLDLKKAKEEDDGSITVRGLLLKCNKWGDAAFLRDYEEQKMDNLEWNGWELKHPDDYPSADTYQPLASLIDFCSTTGDTDFVDGLDEWFYRDNLIDYHLFVTTFSINDNMIKNTFLSTRNLSKGHRWLITPWDLDTSMGENYEGTHTPEFFKDYHVWAYPFARLLETDTLYMEDMRARWQQLSQTTFAEDAIAARLDDYAKQFMASGAWARECARWNNDPVPLTTDPHEELDYVKNWYHRAFAIMEDHFGRQPNGIIHPAASTDGRPQNHNDQRYNLAGQRVSRHYKGIVIENHRKVLKK